MDRQMDEFENNHRHQDPKDPGTRLLLTRELRTKITSKQTASREKKTFGPPDITGPREEDDRHQRSRHRQEHFQGICVRQIVSEQQDQYEQEVGCTVENDEAEPDSNQKQHQQPKRGYTRKAMIILGQCLS